MNRLLLLENIFDLGDQTVKDVMIPWSRVQYLSRSATRDEVMRLLAEHRFSRWPVLGPNAAAPNGYLLMKDMIVQSPGDTAWTHLIRPLQVVSPPENLPQGVDVSALALTRELQLSSDIGHGVAIPHARCPGLARPLMVVGRSVEGILFNAQPAEPARLIFLLVTSVERPNL